MGTSVVRPLAVAHGGYSRQIKEVERAHGAAKAGATGRERNDQLSVRLKKN
jgi:hypothetical protein